MGNGPILVVDDDTDVRVAIAELLAEEGIETITAANGEEALIRLRARPDAHLVLLDLRMPLMDGFRFRTEQLADPRIASVPVLVLGSTVECSEIASELGAVGCFRKPVSTDALLAAVERYR